MKKNLLSLVTLVAFAFLFWASYTPSKTSQTVKSYENVRNKESEPVTVKYDLPIITPSAETEQTQTKGGVTITCEVIPYELTIKDEVNRKIFYADPDKPGYDVYETSHIPIPVVEPEQFELNIKIKNKQDRILKVRETALLMQVDGIMYHIPEASLTDWYAGMIIKNGEFNYKVAGPKFNNLSNSKLVYLLINDVPTIMDEAGNIQKRENFEWYFECKKQTVEKQAEKKYTYETQLVESKRCDKCSGTGTDPSPSTCYGCMGKGSYVGIIDGKIHQCSTCSGTGIVHGYCPDCSGRGKLFFPKSQLPNVTNSVQWSGHHVTIKTKPERAAVKLIDPETGKYKEQKGYMNLYAWYCTSSQSCPIIFEYNGVEVKVMPYKTNGKPSKTITVDFTKGTPIVKGGTKVD